MQTVSTVTVLLSCPVPPPPFYPLSSTFLEGMGETSRTFSIWEREVFPCPLVLQLRPHFTVCQGQPDTPLTLLLPRFR